MLNEVKSRNTGRKIISFMHISFDGFVAEPNGEMNWIKVDAEIFDHVGKRISKGDTVPIAGCSLSPASGGHYAASF